MRVDKAGLDRNASRKSTRQACVRAARSTASTWINNAGFAGIYLRTKYFLLFVTLTALLAATACSERPPRTLRLAVDASFQPALEALRTDFEQQCDCRLHITGAASGLLYSQIREGQHYDVFLSGDRTRPAQLVADDLGFPVSLQTYARGQLALWISRRLTAAIPENGEIELAAFGSARAPELTPRQLILLLGHGAHKLVVADPQLAPDGNAAVRMLKRLRLWTRVHRRMVYASHAGHAQVLLQQGEGEMGVVSYGQALTSGNTGAYMRVPSQFYPEMNHQLVILRDTRERTLAIQFVQYLLADSVQQRLPELGFLPATGIAR